MNSIRARLLAAMLAALAVSALAMGAVTYRKVLAETEALFDYQLQQMALSLRDQGEIAPDQAAALGDDRLDFVIQIWSVDGRAIYASRPHSALPTRAVLGLADVPVRGEIWRSFTVATPGRVIQVAQPQQIRQRRAADAALHSVLPLLPLAPLLALAMSWAVARALRPVRQLAERVRERDAESTVPLPATGLPEEVSPLVAALNGLLQRLGAARDAQRAFVADAAHELRSPLTALKLQVRWLQRAEDAAAQAAAVAALAAGIDRAARLVEQLLALARSEPGAPAAEPEPLDLAELVRQALADTVPYAQSRGTEIELESDAAVTLRGDRTALAALVRNLVDNAVRYAPPGSRVVVRLQAGAEGGGQGPTLTVDDAGPGIPPAERERVFDRFVRRSDGTEAGSGLGLAIVRAVALRHGAEVELGDSPLGGLRVAVRFSVDAAAHPAAAAGAARGPAA
jgi:two-component system OmpR family sensor kinase/two-component system sensor histidine kinase QseC